MLLIGPGDAGRRRSNGLNIAAIHAASDLGDLFDFGDKTSLFQDASATVAVASDGDPIGAARGLRENGTQLLMTQATTSKKPLWKFGYAHTAQGGVNTWLEGAVGATADTTTGFTMVSSFRFNWDSVTSGTNLGDKTGICATAGVAAHTYVGAMYNGAQYDPVWRSDGWSAFPSPLITEDVFTNVAMRSVEGTPTSIDIYLDSTFKVTRAAGAAVSTWEAIRLHFDERSALAEQNTKRLFVINRRLTDEEFDAVMAWVMA